jgi:hypothetical protein
LKKDWRILVGAAAILLTALVVVNPLGFANGDEFIYLPVVSRYDTPTPTATPVRYYFDDFSDEDPEWPTVAIKEEWECDEQDCWGDGYFEHKNGKLLAHIRDNAAGIVVSPLWRTQGDFELEVDARFSSEHTIEHRHKSYNGLGLVFGATEDFSEFYAFMLADGGAQHIYAVVHVKDFRFDYIYDWRGAPADTRYIKPWDGWNRLKVVRRGDQIQIYSNVEDNPLPGGRDLRDSRLGDGYVGLIVTSYEWSNGEMEFDNYELTYLD